jgi:hypothetical protein
VGVVLRQRSGQPTFTTRADFAVDFLPVTVTPEGGQGNLIGRLNFTRDFCINAFRSLDKWCSKSETVQPRPSSVFELAGTQQ